jgi:acetyl-CoA C-acetyltransferase
LTIQELVFQAVSGALDDAALTLDAVDAVFTASVDLWDGLTASNVAITEVVGAVMRPETRIAGDGLGACFQAFLALQARACEVALVVAHCKATMTDHLAASAWTFDPIFQQPLGMDFLSLAALQAADYLQRGGAGEAQWAAVVAKNRTNAGLGPSAAPFPRVSADEVLASPVMVSPIKALDVAPATDGACAVVLAREARDGQTIPGRPAPGRAGRGAGRHVPSVYLSGMGVALDAHYPGDGDLAAGAALRAAAAQAYRMAGVTRPAEEIDLAEVTDAFSYQEPLWVEALGLCEPGGGGRMIESGESALGGRLPVNPSGGMLGGIPPIVSGLARVVEATRQLRGEAGSRQVPGAGAALCHGTVSGQHHVVAVLRRS